MDRVTGTLKSRRDSRRDFAICDSREKCGTVGAKILILAFIYVVKQKREASSFSFDY